MIDLIGQMMPLIIFGALMAVGGVGIVLIIMMARLNKRIRTLEQVAAHQSATLNKMFAATRARTAISTVAENAEIIYQDLLQHAGPIVRALEIPGRESDEHALWRALGGVLDEYNRNPFVLEQLRRLIKLDATVARAVDAFLARSEQLLRSLAATDPEGLLASTFADGLLGQAMTFLSQAKQLAQNNN